MAKDFLRTRFANSGTFPPLRNSQVQSAQGWVSLMVILISLYSLFFPSLGLWRDSSTVSRPVLILFSHVCHTAGRISAGAPAPSLVLCWTRWSGQHCTWWWRDPCRVPTHRTTPGQVSSTPPIKAAGHQRLKGFRVLELSWVLPCQLCSSPLCLMWWAVPPLPCHSSIYSTTTPG